VTGTERARRYGTAVLSVAAASSLALAVGPLHENSSLLLVALGVAIGARQGAGPGLCATAAGIASAAWLLSSAVPPSGALAARIGPLALLAALGLAMTWLFDRLRGSAARLAAANQALELEVAKLRSAHTALLESEERHRTLATATSSIVLVIGPDGLPTEHQPSWEAYTGQSPEQYLAPEGGPKAIHPEDQERFRREWLAASTAPGPVESEFRLWHAPTGGYRHVLQRGAPVLREDGTVREWVITFKDVHDRKMAEQAAGETEARLQAAFEQLAAGVALTSPELRFLKVNAALCRFLGYEPAELAGKLMADITHPDDIPESVAISRRLFDGEIPAIAMEKRYVRKDCSTVWGSTVASLVRDAGGVPRYAIAVIQDITERKRVEQALAESERRLTLAQSAARLATVDVDLLAGKLSASGEYCALFGLPPGPPVPLAQTEAMIHPADRERVERIMSGQVVDEAEFRVVWPDGSVHWILGKGKAFLDQSGRPIRMVGVLMDITERKRLEERLREAHKLESLGVLASGLAHDFNNLLTAILGFTTLTREQLPAGSAVGGYLKAIEAAGQEAAQLTAQVLAYSGKGLSAVRPVDLSALAGEMATLIRASLPHNISLELELPPGLPAIDADLKQLQQAFLNLTGNAAEAIGGAAGVIRISTSVREIDGAHIQRELAGSEIEPGRRVCLEVRDNGCGMDEETRAQVFDPFYSTKFLGRGLGLAAVAGIARGHGAAIQVESAPGRGSTFRLLFRPSNNSAAQC
jgi:PAS domain S-box-containing protein